MYKVLKNKVKSLQVKKGHIWGMLFTHCLLRTRLKLYIIGISCMTRVKLQFHHQYVFSSEFLWDSVVKVDII